MNGIRSIDGFEKMILEAFSNLIKEFELSYLSKSNELGDELFLVGESCELRFTYDRGDFNCSFINPKNRQQFSSNLVYEILFPNDKRFYFSINDPINEQIKTYATMIESKLKNVLKGDFEWDNVYKKKYR